MTEPAPALCGLVLAAGAGTRYGEPKALARATDGTPWVALAVRMLRDAGCHSVLVALGAAAAEAAALVPREADIVIVESWRDGLSATLRAGLDAAVKLPADALVITPVDTPSAPAAAAERVIDSALPTASARSALARAVYGGRPGHPVLIGREHWGDLWDAVTGDSGAGRYLQAHGVMDVECGDLWSGADVDRR